MSTDNGGSASMESTGSAVDSQGANETNQQTQSIKYEDHLRAIEDLKKFKARSRELESKLEQLSTEIEQEKHRKLSDSNDFKTLYEQASSKNKEWESRYQKLKENVVYNEKYKAAQKALLDAGIRKDALKILEREDLEPIVVEHTSEGRMLVSGVEEYVDSFRKNFGFAFEDKSKTRVNGNGGTIDMTSGQKIDAAKLIELERKHGIKSPEYLAAYAEYKKQKQKPI